MTGQPFFARFWMHAAMVRYQGEKMSKSLGNLIWARDLLQDYTADAVRILIHNHPYHESWEYDASELEPAAGMANVLLCGVQVQGGQGPTMDPSAAVGAFEEAMNDNLNTPEALAVLTELAGRIAAAAAGGHDVARAQAALRRMGGVFGLRFDGDVEPRVRAGWTVHMSRFE
jgi:L-cysteine:1D-myo-inositol 2-amino-2-deoxy-alpha-D-glucopyranoside ligase